VEPIDERDERDEDGVRTLLAGETVLEADVYWLEEMLGK